MNTKYPAVLRLALVAATAGAFTFLAARPVMAVGQEPTAIAIAAPATATLGDTVTVQARLVSSAGPIEKATVDFVLPATFLNIDGDMAVASGTTDADGLATATFEARITGDLKVKAMFPGDNKYAASEAATPMSVGGSKQLYVPDIGIRLRGVTSSPIGQDSTVSHWLLSGWPIGALLVLVWSTYGAAVFFMSRISADASHDPEVPQ
jgi:hypothetical protein